MAENYGTGKWVGNEIRIGHFPKNDGSDYDPAWKHPSWTSIRRAVNDAGTEAITIIIRGKLYGKAPISGFGFYTSATDIFNAGTSSGTFNEQIAELMNLNEVPEHITGVVIIPGNKYA